MIRRRVLREVAAKHCRGTTVSRRLYIWLSATISVRPLAGVAGVFEITIETPPGIQEGDAIPLMLVISRPAGPLASIGRAIQSNDRVEEQSGHGGC